MSSYVMEVRRPERELCPFHGTKFRKKGHFYHCERYGECGYSIGSRKLQGCEPSMWIQQTKRGKAHVLRHVEAIRRCTEVFESITLPPVNITQKLQVLLSP